MSLQSLIIDALAKRSLSARELKAEFPDESQVAIDCAVDALRRAGSLTIYLSRYVRCDRLGVECLRVAGEVEAALTPPPTVKPKRPTLVLSNVLTRRERQVMELISQGKKGREVAAFLGITESTVNGHRTAIYHKTGAIARRRRAGT